MILSTLCAAMAALALEAAPGIGDGTPPGPLLTLEDAVARARNQNHGLASVSREVDRTSEHAAALRTRRLPVFDVEALGSRLLQPFDFSFPAGSFGTFPPLGPFPPAEADIRVPAAFNAAFTASVSQPLTQQYRIGLGLEAVGLEREIAEENVRREKQRVTTETRATYYQLSATESGVAALRDLVRAFEEVDSLTSRYLTEGLALRPDALEVKARLARERQRLSAAESGLATQREHLNQLVGQDLATPFRVMAVSNLPLPQGSLSLEQARRRARANRPELREASLRAAQAETAVKLAHADYIPEVTLVGTYTRLVNIPILPTEVAFVGLTAKWEPFDWGRRLHEAKEHELTVDEAREARAEADGQVAVEVGQIWRALRDDAALLEADRLGLEAAQASLGLMRNRYHEDARVLRDVLTAEAQTSAARHDYMDALAAYWSEAAALERAIGDED